MFIWNVTFGWMKKVREEKREYKRQRARVDNLPKEYSYVYKKIEKYLWMHAGGTGMDMLRVLYDLVDLFEENATMGKKVLEVTGPDVAEFCDELLKNATTYTGKWRKDLNKKIAKKIEAGNWEEDDE
jgi:DNA-binding ferritin-like protein (Dps family)